MPFVIIVGRGHSGTRAISKTLVEAGYFMGNELNASYDLIPAEKMYKACRIAGALVQPTTEAAWDFRTLLAEPIPDAFRNLVRAYAHSVLESESPNRGWKLPETILALPWICRMFPEAHYIYWVRDPRDAILGSHLTDDLSDFGVRYRPTENIREMRAISWKYQRAIVAATPRPKNWLQVRFEDFVLKQDEVLNELERFLGTPLARIEVRPDSIGRWKQDVDAHDYAIFHDDLLDLGYLER